MEKEMAVVGWLCEDGRSIDRCLIGRRRWDWAPNLSPPVPCPTVHSRRRTSSCLPSLHPISSLSTAVHCSRLQKQLASMGSSKGHKSTPIAVHPPSPLPT